MFEDSPDGFVVKWTQGIAMKGFAAIPNCLLFCQAELGLNVEEAIVLLHLLAYYWKRDSRIFPSAATIAHSLGKTDSTVRRKIRILEEKKFLIRKFRQGNSNIYDISFTINKLQQHLSECTWGKQRRIPASARVNSQVYPAMPTNEDNQTILTDNNFMSDIDFFKYQSETFDANNGPYNHDD